MNKKIIIFTNYIAGLYWFRRELVEKLVNEKYEVIISSPKDSQSNAENYFRGIGCSILETDVDRRGINPLNDLKLFFKYIKTIKNHSPRFALTYTIKPNVFGGIACRVMGVPYISNITGLGTSIENRGLLSRISLSLYRVGLKRAKKVFFQNNHIKNFMVENNIVEEERTKVIPGSGVNIEHHKLAEYPPQDGKQKFLFIGRIMKSKGVDELLEAAKIIKKDFPESEFHFIGEKENDYDDTLFNEMVSQVMIAHHGRMDDVRPFIAESHAIVIPSYHEGMCNVLLEAASTGRPVLASTVPGCIETFDQEVSGLGCEAKSVESLVATIRKFIKMPYEEKKRMGIEGRKKMEREFDRDIVVRAYMDEIESKG
jgi:glycosyltransferase involved in cell wall biosynthesis